MLKSTTLMKWLSLRETGLVNSVFFVLFLAVLVFGGCRMLDGGAKSGVLRVVFLAG